MRIAAAAYPIDWLESWAAYEAKQSAWVDEAAGQGAELLVFPEYGAMELASLAGAEAAGDLARARAAVSGMAPRAAELHAGLAQRYGVMIVAGSGPVETGEGYVNRAGIYMPDGRSSHQDKQIMTRFEAETWGIRPGGALRLFETPMGKIGVLICYDAEFPLLGRALIEAGADVIAVPSATETAWGHARVAIGARARALEGQCVTAMASTVGQAPWCEAVDENAGAGGIFGPPDNGFPSDGIISQGMMNRPGWTFGTADTAALAALRRDGTVLNHRDWSAQDTRAIGVEHQCLM